MSGSGSHEPLRCSERSHRRSSVWAGRFEDNAFLLLPPGRTVGFVPTPRAGAAELLGDEAFGVFAASLRVEDHFDIHARLIHMTLQRFIDDLF